MQALCLDTRLQLKEVPTPVPQAGEVLIRLRLAGLCRTDLEMVRGYHPFKGVLGHEFVGQVAGPPGSPWLGRRVVGEINVGCGRCPYCRAGQTRHCPERQVLGIRSRDGAFAPYLTLPEANLHEVPLGVPDDAAVFTEPLAAALAVLAAASISPGRQVLVGGDGPLGLLISWAVSLTGAQVHLAGHYPDHLALAEPYGVITYLEKDLPERNYEVVVEASGAPGGLDLALKRVRPGGKVVLKSTFAGHYPLETAALVVPEVSLIGCRCGPFAPALELLQSGRVDPRVLISRRFPLSQGLEAFAWAGQPGALKVLIDFS